MDTMEMCRRCGLRTLHTERIYEDRIDVVCLACGNVTATLTADEEMED